MVRRERAAIRASVQTGTQVSPQPGPVSTPGTGAIKPNMEGVHARDQAAAKSFVVGCSSNLNGVK